MELHYLELFNSVAEYESFKKASEVLHISQPALSIQIKKLEEQIGLKLFNKIGNKICLSENGLMLYEYTKKIMSIVNELEYNISTTKNFIGGTINIGGSNTPGTYILPELIGLFKKSYPNTKINLNIANTSEIAHSINNGTLDFAINGGNLDYSSYIYSEKLIEEKLVLVASPLHPLAEKTKVTAEELTTAEFVVHKTDSQLYTYYKMFVEDIGIPEKISMYLGNIDAIKRAVCSNLGIALIPYSAVRLDIKFGQLKELKLVGVNPTYPYSLIYNKNKSLSVTSKKFIELIHETIEDYKYKKASRENKNI